MSLPVPAAVTLRRIAPEMPETYGIVSRTGQLLDVGSPPTLAGLAKLFYGDPALWRIIARDNSVSGGAGSTPLNELNPFNKSRITFTTGRAVTIPAPPQTTSYSGDLQT